MPHNTTFQRIRAEYVEMPALRLTLEQAQRLCGVERALCKKVLDALVQPYAAFGPRARHREQLAVPIDHLAGLAVVDVVDVVTPQLTR